MSQFIEIEVTGAANVNQVLREFGKDAYDALMIAIKKIVIRIESAAKLRLREREHWVTGRLASSIHSEVKGGVVDSSLQVRSGGYEYTAPVTGESFNGNFNENIEDLEALVGTNVNYSGKIENMDSYLRWAAMQSEGDLKRYITEQMNRVAKVANDKLK